MGQSRFATNGDRRLKGAFKRCQKYVINTAWRTTRALAFETTDLHACGSAPAGDVSKLVVVSL